MRWFLALLPTLALAGVVGDPFSGVPISINGTPGAATIILAANFDKGGEGIAFHDARACTPAAPVAQVPSIPAPVITKTLSTDTIPPSVPTGLVAVAVSPTQVNLTWNPSIDNVAVMSYQVYLNNARIADTFSTSYMHTGLTPGTAYSYRVGAADFAPNYSLWSDPPVAVTTPILSASACCTPAYRPDGLNVCASGAVTYIPLEAGDWISFTVQLASVGSYTVELLAAVSDPTAAYHVELDGARVTETIALGTVSPTYVWAGKSGFIQMIPGNTHTLRVVVDAGSFKLDSLRIAFAAGIEWLPPVPVFKIYRP